MNDAELREKASELDRILAWLYQERDATGFYLEQVAPGRVVVKQPPFEPLRFEGWKIKGGL